MDIVVKGILSYIQNLEGHKNSVLAGGAVRDEIFGLVPNDYDFFVPSKHPRDIEYLVQSLGREFTLEGAICKSKDYGFLKKKRVSSNGQSVLSVWGFKFEGKKIDLIGLQENDDEDFPFEVIRSFDYGINMVYDNGSYIDTECSDYRSDRDNHYMSLVNLHDIKGLPKAIKRFETFNERQKKVTGEDLMFRAPCLELRGKKEKKENPYRDIYEEAVSFPTTVSGTFVREGLDTFRTAVSGTFTESQFVNPAPTLNEILNSQRTTNTR